MTANSEWKHIDTIPDGVKFKIRGLNIWDYQWMDTGKRATVKDPLYGKEHILGIYEIQKGDLKATFAAGEFSNCMWGIYIEKQMP